MDRLKRAAFFGGTFDPPHNGHLFAVKYVLANCEIDKLVVAPSYAPPHKSENVLNSFDDRMNMAELLFASVNDSRLLVTGVEKDLPEPSFTWQTMGFLEQLYHGWNFSIIIGWDMYMGLQSWSRYDLLMQRYSFIILRRENDIKKDLRTIRTRDLVLPNPVWDISSTMIRKQLQEYYDNPRSELKEKFEHYFSPELLEYILEKNLYK